MPDSSWYSFCCYSAVWRGPGPCPAVRVPRREAAGAFASGGGIIMGLLQSENALYYHPLDDLVEATKSLVWSSSGGFDFPSGKVGNAMRASTSLSQARVTYSPASTYGNLIGSTRFACAFWTSGLFDPDYDNHQIDVGFGNLDDINGLRNGFKLRNSGGTLSCYGTWIGLSSAKPISSSHPTDGGWHFVVMDLELEATWRLRVSFDGQPFADEGLFGASNIPDSDGRTFIQTVRAPGAPEMRVDEVAVWSGHDTFTSEELANLYDLGETFGEGLDKYEEHYGAPICWQATAVMPDGTVWRDSGGGPCPHIIRVPRGAADVVVTDDGRVVRPRIVEG